MTQESVSTLWGSDTAKATQDFLPFSTDEQAKRARDERYRELKEQGLTARRSVLKGQLRQYWSYGVECGHVCDVYMVTFQ